MSYTIKLIDKMNIHSIILLARILNPKLDDEVLLDRIMGTVENPSYQCVGIYFNEELVGICGIWILTRIWAGKYIELDNVIIHPNYQSKGVGDKLLSWVFNYGKTQGCTASILACYVTNDKAIKFWIKNNYKIVGYNLIQSL